MAELDPGVGKAVKRFWSVRQAQGKQQGARSGIKDAGNRTQVTGGKQMSGFEELVESLLVENGIPAGSIYSRRKRELPGYFRAEKCWDLVIVHERQLVAAMEFKSQVGSFGNNFNNRTEEAIGNATDLWTAFREGAFSPSPRPWLGYMMMLEDAPAVARPVAVREPHFSALPEFQDASYARRYELLVLRLVRERLYDAACFLLSNRTGGRKGLYRQPNPEIAFAAFATSLIAHASGHIGE